MSSYPRPHREASLNTYISQFDEVDSVSHIDLGVSFLLFCLQHCFLRRTSKHASPIQRGML